MFPLRGTSGRVLGMVSHGESALRVGHGWAFSMFPSLAQMGRREGTKYSAALCSPVTISQEGRI